MFVAVNVDDDGERALAIVFDFKQKVTRRSIDPKRNSLTSRERRMLLLLPVEWKVE